MRTRLPPSGRTRRERDLDTAGRDRPLSGLEPFRHHAAFDLSVAAETNYGDDPPRWMEIGGFNPAAAAVIEADNKGVEGFENICTADGFANYTRKLTGAVKNCWPMACLYRSLRFGEEYLPVSALLVDKT